METDLMQTRRALLTGLLAATCVRTATAELRRPLYLSARGEAGGAHFATGFDAAGRLAFDLPLPARGHAFAVHPAGLEAVVFARRPGDYALVIDPERGRAVRRIPAAPGHWFNGHGAYAADGNLLYATETRAADGQGVIGVYDSTREHRRLGEVETGGLDPHEIRLLADGRTLVVANGGLLTHPDAPRLKFNIDGMRPSLVWMDAASGRRLRQVAPVPELHQLGTRHLALAGDGSVLVAMQWEGPRDDLVPLVARHRPDAPGLEMLDLPEEVLAGLDGYCGSAAVAADGTTLAVSSPRGGRVVFWDLAADRLLGVLGLDDGCGIAPAGGGAFLLSNGFGRLVRFDPMTGRRDRLAVDGLPGARWDNHIAVLA